MLGAWKEQQNICNSWVLFNSKLQAILILLGCIFLGFRTRWQLRNRIHLQDAFQSPIIHLWTQSSHLFDVENWIFFAPFSDTKALQSPVTHLCLYPTRYTSTVWGTSKIKVCEQRFEIFLKQMNMIIFKTITKFNNSKISVKSNSEILIDIQLQTQPSEA